MRLERLASGQELDHASRLLPRSLLLRTWRSTAANRNIQSFMKNPLSLTATYIGGPTALFKWNGVRFLTDPTFDPAGGKYVNGPVTLEKIAGPAVSAESLGPGRYRLPKGRSVLAERRSDSIPGRALRFKLARKACASLALPRSTALRT